MPVRFFYVDESHDQKFFCLSAIAIRHSDWHTCFDLVKKYRKKLHDEHEILLRKEIHARDLVRGRGRLGPKTIGKWDRTRIFRGFLELIAQLPGIQIFNICLPNRGLRDAQMIAWDRLVNRIERTMRKMEEQELPKRKELASRITEVAKTPERSRGLESREVGDIAVRLNTYRARAFIIADEGREAEITRAIRRMHIHNLIPSQFGEWEPGVTAKNITTQRIIEDPVFKASSRSYFLQLADCVAFALLKQETEQTPLVRRYGLADMFKEKLKNVCFKQASPRDPQGVVRK